MIETITIGNTKIRVTQPEIPKKEDLKNMYDVMNEIGLNLMKQKKDISKMFYSKEEIEEKKKSNKYVFID